jgi:hypothetical protein
MGRAPLILFILLLFSIQISAGYEVSYTRSFEKYYTGGEYLRFEVVITPESSTEGKNLDGADYHIYTNLENSGIIVEINLTSGKLVIHPTPEDEYKSENGTHLKFYLPEGGNVGVSKFKVRIFGYVPEISERIKELTIVSISKNSEKLDEKSVTAVNKHIFYQNIKDLEENLCDGKDLKVKLDEALSLYYDEKYIEADEKLKEVEKEVAKCWLEKKSKELEDELDSLKEKLSDIRKDLTLIGVKLEVNREKYGDSYEMLNLKLSNLTQEYGAIDGLIDEAKDLIDEGRLDVARDEIENISSRISSLEDEVIKLSVELENIKNEEFDLVWIVVVAAVGVIALAVIVLIRYRRRDRW